MPDPDQFSEPHLPGELITRHHLEELLSCCQTTELFEKLLRIGIHERMMRAPGPVSCAAPNWAGDNRAHPPGPADTNAGDPSSDHPLLCLLAAKN